MPRKLKPRHHSVRRGQRVFVELADGTRYVTKFYLTSDNNKDLVTEHGTWPWRKVRKFRIYKGGPAAPPGEPEPAQDG